MTPAEPILNAPPEAPPWQAPRFGVLPGTLPLGPPGWPEVSETHAAQMAERERLLAERPGEVAAALPGSEAALDELLGMVLDALAARSDFAVSAGQVCRPDGRWVSIDRARPLDTLGRLVQEDLCLIERREGAHVLTAAVLCFPLHWTLSEKLGRPLARIHRPVPGYDDAVARRVDRLFDGLRPGRPIERTNGVVVPDAVLFRPAPEAHHGTAPLAERRRGGFYRSERQCLLRLPQSGAVLFSIHTRQWRLADLPGAPPPEASPEAPAEPAHPAPAKGAPD